MRERFLLWRDWIHARPASRLEVTEYCKLRSPTTPCALESNLLCVAPKDSTAVPAVSAQLEAPQRDQYIPEELASSVVAKHLTIRASGVAIDGYSDFNPTLVRSIIQAIGANQC